MIRKSISILLVFLLMLGISTTALAAEEDHFVFDEAGILTEEQWEELEITARAISEQYEIGVYIITVDHYSNYSSKEEPFDATWDIYHSNELGWGKEREGLVVLLSMQSRDCVLFVYGQEAEYAFNAYGQEQLENEYLDHFREDDWYGGFRSYLTTAGRYLSKAESNNPVREDPAKLALILVAVGWGLAMVITAVMYGSMISVRKGTHADAYIGGNGLRLHRQDDVFVNRTQTYRTIETDDSSSGSRSHSGGGGSGRSSKF